MACNSISEYSSALRGGLKGNRYKVVLTLPSGITGDTKLFSLIVRSTNVPAMETGSIDVQYKGCTTILSSGDTRPAGEWQTQAQLNNGNSAGEAKKIVEKWQKLTENTDPTVYKSRAFIELINPIDDSVALKWQVDGIWIYNSGELELGDENVDSILELPITFKYDNVTPLH